jgi:hypothetical protein
VPRHTWQVFIEYAVQQLPAAVILDVFLIALPGASPPETVAGGVACLAIATTALSMTAWLGLDVIIG